MEELNMVIQSQAAEQRRKVLNLIYLEGILLDERKWDEWLALFSPDVEFWVPSWKSEHELVSDPLNEVSLAWYPSRDHLEDRIYRIRTGLSPASNPLPRTVHLITNSLIRQENDGKYLVTSNFQVNCFRDQELSCYTGYYEHLIMCNPDSCLILKKKVVIVNDILRVMDIYCF